MSSAFFHATSIGRQGVLLPAPAVLGTEGQVLALGAGGVLDWATGFTAAGVAGGQSVTGGTASGENLTLQSTAHATKGKIYLGANSAYDEANARLGIGTTSPGYTVDLGGGTASGTRYIHIGGTVAGVKFIEGGSGLFGITLQHNGLADQFELLTHANNATGSVAIAVERSGGRVGINKSSGLTDQLHVVCGAAARVGVSVQAAASQSANLFQTLLSDGTSVRARVTSAGSFSNTGGQTGSEIFGLGASVSGGDSAVFGASSSATAGNATVVGYSASVTASYGMAVGKLAVSAGGTAVGGQANVSSTGVGVGRTAIATGSGSIAIGHQPSSTHNGSIALGYEAATTSTNQLVVGGNTNTYAINEVYFGKGVTNTVPNTNTLVTVTGGSGTDISGANLTLAGGRSTGSGTPGKIIFQTTTVGSSGSTLRNLTTIATINQTGLGVLREAATYKLEVADSAAVIGSGNTYSIVDRGSTSNWGVVQYRTAGSLDWYVGLTANATGNWAVADGGGNQYITVNRSSPTGIVGINKSSSIGAQLHVQSGGASRVGLRVDAAASQSANLFESYEAGGGLRACVTSAGSFSNTGGQTRTEIFGSGAAGSGVDAVAAGFNAAVGAGGVAVGRSASEFGSGVAIGYLTTTTAGSAVAVGYSTTAASSGVRIGALGSCESQAVSVGYNNTTISGSITLGYIAVSTAAAQFVAGSGSRPISDVYFGKGVTHATPTAYTINGTGGNGTDIAGANLVLAGGRPTGAGAGGSVIIQTAAAGASGTTLRSLVDRVTVTSAGNVGVGTGSPQCLTHILAAGTPGTPSISSNTRLCVQASDTAARAANILIISGNTGNASLLFGDTDSESVGRVVYDHANDALRFHAATNERVTINNSGLGVNKSSSLGAQLHVVSSGAAKVGLIVQAAATPSESIQQWQDSAGSTYGEIDSAFALRLYNLPGATNYEMGRVRFLSNAFRIDTTSGGTGTSRDIEISAASTKQYVTGVVPWFGLLDTAGATNHLTFRANGNIYTTGGITIYSQSYTNRMTTSGDTVRFRLVTSTGFFGLGAAGIGAPGLKPNGATLQVRLGDDSGFTKIQGDLQTTANAVTETIVPDKTLTLYDAAGTAYKVPCVAA